MKYLKYIEENTIRCETSSRGGGIEIDLSDLLNGGVTDKYDGYKMTAYQNYLGGGMLGRVCHDWNFTPEELPRTKFDKVMQISRELKEYFHDLTVHDGEWEFETFEHNQLTKPVSAY